MHLTHQALRQFVTNFLDVFNPSSSTSIRDDDDVIEYTTDPELIYEKWKDIVDVVIDGGYGDNEASTVIDLTDSEPFVIREGKGSLDIL